MKLSRLLCAAGLPAADMDVEITGVTAGSDGNLLGKMFVLRPGREKKRGKFNFKGDFKRSVSGADGEKHKSVRADGNLR